MILVTFGVIFHRILLGKGLGARAIQFLSVGYIIPTILILSLEKVLTSETTAALLGGLAGYLLSDVGKFESKESRKESPEKTAEKE